MNCNEFSNLGTGVLDGEDHPEAHTHLASCPRCRALLTDLESIQTTARSLPSYQPNDYLWNRIQRAALEEGLWTQPAPARWLGWLETPALPSPAFAGALAMMFLLAAGLVGYSSVDLGLPEAPPLSALEVAQGELVQEAGYSTRYQIHLARLEDRVLDQPEPLDAELRELVAGPMEAVDRAINETQVRLNNHPDDTLAREELHRLYREKAVVLQAMTDPMWYSAGR